MALTNKVFSDFLGRSARLGTLLGYGLGMAGKRVESAAVRGARALRDMLAETGDWPLEDLERRAKALTAMARAGTRP